MLRTDSEYKEALRLLEQDKYVIAQQKKILEAMDGLTRDEIDRGLEPMICFHSQLKEEVELYEKSKL